MKLPTSSSIFLTTLAISTSSSCLAAPTGDTATGQSMTSSSRLDGASPEAHIQQRSEGYGNVEARDGLISAVGQTVGQTVEGVTGAVDGLASNIPVIGKQLDANGNPTPQDSSAPGEADRALGTVGNTLNSTLPAPLSPVGNAAGHVISNLPSNLPGPAGALSDDPNDGTGTVSAAPPSQTASAAAAVAPPVPPAAPQPPSAPGAPSPPVSPPVPPNTPALPVNLPV